MIVRRTLLRGLDGSRPPPRLQPRSCYSILSKYRFISPSPIPSLPSALASKIPRATLKPAPAPPPVPQPEGDQRVRMTDRNKAVAEVAYVPKEQPADARKAPIVVRPLPREAPGNLIPDQPTDPRSLSIAIVGAPNAGKSTLVNRIITEKISAVSHKAQTTRKNILGVHTNANKQLVFIDTPGVVPIWQQKSVVRSIVTSAWHAAFEAELILFLVDAARRVDEPILHILSQIRKITTEGKHQPLLVLNKADLVTRRLLLQRNEELNADKLFTDVFVISATQGSNVDSLLEYLYKKAVPRDWEYHSSVKTTQTDKEIALEVVREKIFGRFNQEIPYIVKQTLRSWVDFPNGDLAIDTLLHVEKNSQKAMIIGRAGSGLKAITNAAAADLSQIFKRPVRLFLSVKVDPETSKLDDATVVPQPLVREALAAQPFRSLESAPPNETPKRRPDAAA